MQRLGCDQKVSTEVYGLFIDRHQVLQLDIIEPTRSAATHGSDGARIQALLAYPARS
jgi:hypothetical protein